MWAEGMCLGFSQIRALYRKVHARARIGRQGISQPTQKAPLKSKKQIQPITRIKQNILAPGLLLGKAIGRHLGSDIIGLFRIQRGYICPQTRVLIGAVYGLDRDVQGDPGNFSESGSLFLLTTCYGLFTGLYMKHKNPRPLVIHNIHNSEACWGRRKKLSSRQGKQTLKSRCPIMIYFLKTCTTILLPKFQGPNYWVHLGKGSLTFRLRIWSIALHWVLTRVLLQQSQHLHSTCMIFHRIFAMGILQKQQMSDSKMIQTHV